MAPDMVGIRSDGTRAWALLQERMDSMALGLLALERAGRGQGQRRQARPRGRGERTGLQWHESRGWPALQHS